MKHLVKRYLEQEPKFRERVNRSRGAVNLLLTIYPEIKAVPKEDLIQFCEQFESVSRYVRMIQAENPELRGKDYETKNEVEEKKMLELGYGTKKQSLFVSNP